MSSVTSHHLFVKLVWLMVFVIIATFWSTVFYYAYNFPYYDDFQAIVLFLTNFIKSESLWGKLNLFFEQNFEHRVVFAKLLTVIVFFLTGQINIKTLIIIGDLSLLGTLFLLFKFLLKKQLSLLSFFTIVCLLFQVQHYEDTISWATCSLQHAPCLFFSMWSFYLAIHRKNIIWSSILALAALFTSANGLSSIVIVMIISWSSRTPKHEKIIQTLVLASITGLHLLTIQIHSGSMLDHVFKNVVAKTFILLSFVGQLADTNYTNSTIASAMLGLLFLMPLFQVIRHLINNSLAEIHPLQWFCVAGIISLLFVGFLIIFARGELPDHHGYKLDRYKIYSAFFAIFTVAFFDRYLSFSKRGLMVKSAMATAALAFCISSYYIYFEKITHFNREISANELNYNWSKTVYYPVIFKDVNLTNNMDFAQQTFMPSSKSRLVKLVGNINWKEYTKPVDSEIINLPDRFIVSNGKQSQQNPQAEELYIVATDASDNQPKYFCTASNNYIRSIKHFYTTFQRSVGSEFTSTIHKSKLKRGRYNLYLLSITDGNSVKIQSVGAIAV